MVRIEPLEGADLVWVVDCLPFVNTSKLAVAKPSSDLLRGEPDLVGQYGDGFFLFGTNVPFPSLKIPLQALPLVRGEVHNHPFSLVSSLSLHFWRKEKCQSGE